MERRAADVFPELRVVVVVAAAAVRSHKGSSHEERTLEVSNPWQVDLASVGEERERRVGGDRSLCMSVCVFVRACVCSCACVRVRAELEILRWIATAASFETQRQFRSW